MIGWIIFSVLMLILAVLLFSSVKISLSINDAVRLSISYLGFALFVFDSANKNRNSKEKPKNTSKESDNNSFVSFLKRYAESKKKTELVKELFEILKLILTRFKKLLKKVRFKVLLLDLSIASEDAANTAILYGRICTLIYPLISMLSVSSGFSADKISVKTDFLSEDIKLELSSVAKIRISSLLIFAVSTALLVVRFKIGDLKNA